MGSETTQWDGTLPEELERYLTPVEDEQEQLLRFEQLMGWERGTEASEALNATDFRIRRLHQLREEVFHRISLVVREYRELLSSRAIRPLPADVQAVEPSVEDAWGALDRAVCRDARFKDDGVVKHQMDLLSATLASLAHLQRGEAEKPQPVSRNDDRRESDRHPPRPL